MKGYIKFSGIDIEDPDAQFQIEISNGICSTILDFYSYPDFLKDFALQLIDFPKNINDTAKIEIGKDDSAWACYLLITAFCYDGLGHAALKIIAKNNGDEISSYKSEFSILSEVASINKLGQLLASWDRFKKNEIIWHSHAD